MISEPSAPPVPLCKDCKHCIPDPDFKLQFAVCAKSEPIFNRVTGDTRHVYCSSERGYEIDGCGGPDGKNFEPKD